jgi:hypothetical protein
MSAAAAEPDPSAAPADDTATPVVPAQRVFERIEPVFTRPPGAIEPVFTDPAFAGPTAFGSPTAGHGADPAAFAGPPAFGTERTAGVPAGGRPVPVIQASMTDPVFPVIPQQRVSEETTMPEVLPPPLPPGHVPPPPGYVAPPPRYVPPPPGYNAPPPGYPAAPQGYAAAPPGYPPAAPPGYPPQPGYTGSPGYPQPGYGQPGYGYPQPGYAQPPGMPPLSAPAMQLPQPPRKKHTGRNMVVALVSLAVLVGLPGVAAALTAAPAASKPITLPQLPDPVDLTKVGDNTRDRATVISRQLETVFDAQEKAMAARDEGAFLKAVATSSAAAALRLRFRNLAAMKVAEFGLSASFPEADKTPGRWKSTLAIEYCFGKPGCTKDIVREPSVWQDTVNGPMLVSLAQQPVGNEWFEQPQPWEQTPLIAAVGQRVVVAMPVSLKSRLSIVLREADKAAVVADSYAVGTKPDFYRIYVANTSEWRTWFGNKPSKWVAGYTTSTGASHGDVVINTAEAPNSYLPTMLRHEMTHAASTYGRHYSRSLWWLIEGYAELAEPTMPSGLRSFIRGYIRGTWNGRLPQVSPSASASVSSVSGQYGVAYAAMYYLQKKYGKAALITFFEKVVRNGLPMETASQDSFHASWASVEAATVKAVRAF